MCLENMHRQRNPLECLRGTECENAHGNEACDGEKQACFAMWKGAPNLKFRIVSVKTLPLFGHVVLLSAS